MAIDQTHHTATKSGLILLKQVPSTICLGDLVGRVVTVRVNAALIAKRTRSPETDHKK